MKKILICMAAILLSGLYANAQTDSSKQPPHLYINAQADTFAAIQDPEFLMAVKEDSFTTIQFPNYYSNIITSGLYQGNAFSGFIFQSSASINYGLTGDKGIPFKFRWLAHDSGAIDYRSVTDEIMTLDNNGNLYIKGNAGIGTYDTKGYKLAVNGAAIFTRVKIEAYANWPDFVFEPEYKLPSLQALESYIKEHKHLPDVPSAAEVRKEGIDVADMNKILLQKIEELTLHLIEQDKVNKELKLQMQQQKEQITKLNKSVNNLTSK